jgi:type III restriction enzyme
MNARVQHAVNGRLSLRAPQAESLACLVRALAAAPDLLGHERDVASILAILQSEFPKLEDFEREFPSLCFALATGVGKTRLMGAFISYLHLAHGINNFFVLAPNLTIYNKLISDFTRNTPKYVFKGIAEFAQQSPLIITGDNYDQTGAAIDDQPRGFAQDVRINIFNISKISSEMRGGKEPRIKRMKEVLGDSYFNHLASLPDLVLLMDESHRYRASAGVRAINELKPLFGLELTATPFVEAGGNKTVPFKNVVLEYPLAKALEDGFVKEPAVVTQRNFVASDHTPEEVEKVKLKDGVRLHEITKVELLTYARENSVKVVKPFMLVIARDTTHAGQLLALLESSAFYEGRYQGKVIQVDSSRTGAEEEEMINRLLAVESVDEPTEIVVHVNMLKEGWDVTNLYTIVPLRAANARTLIEQSIGRGLRLPYGKRTGVDAVDRLNIVAHDRFQEIIDDANRADSSIRLKQVILDAPGADDRRVSVTVASGTMAQLGLTDAPVIVVAPFGGASATDAGQTVTPPAPVFATDGERHVARLVVQVISELEVRRDLAPTSIALLTPGVQAAILAEVTERLQPLQGNLLAEADAAAVEIDLAAVIAKTTAIVVQQTIDIPSIVVVPAGEISTGFHPFTLDVSQLNLQSGPREIVGQTLRTNLQFTVAAQGGLRESRLENYIVHALVDYDDLDYVTQADLLYALAGQAVDHFRAKNYSEDEMHDVLDTNRRLIASDIHAQMMSHFWEKATSYDTQVNRGFSALKPCNYTATVGQTAHHFRETVIDLSRIRQMLFGGFTKCLYPLQKFDSDTERRFAILLERDALKWFKPAKGQFQIFYKLGTEQPEYIPDFVAEADTVVYMVETKARIDINTTEVLAKASAAVRWCQLASAHATEVGSKPWKYLLVPHDQLAESNRLSDYLRFEVLP